MCSLQRQVAFLLLIEELNGDKNEILAFIVRPLVVSKFANEKKRSFFFDECSISYNKMVGHFFSFGKKNDI